MLHQLPGLVCCTAQDSPRQVSMHTLYRLVAAESRMPTGGRPSRCYHEQQNCLKLSQECSYDCKHGSILQLQGCLALASRELQSCSTHLSARSAPSCCMHVTTQQNVLPAVTCT